jgi:hypothetical protein
LSFQHYKLLCYRTCFHHQIIKAHSARLEAVLDTGEADGTPVEVDKL